MTSKQKISVASKIKSKRKNKYNSAKLSFTKRIFIFPLLIFAALFLAQSLKLPLSYMTFVFTLTLPFISIIYLLFSVIFIRTSVKVSKTTVEKNTHFDFVSLISNNSILPFPFIEATVCLPDKTGAKCTPHSFLLCLAPFDYFEIRRPAEFAFRGEYEIGLSEISVYDPFRTVKLSLPCRHKAHITVLPRRLELSPKNNLSESELTNITKPKLGGNDTTETSDIRDYIPGDPLKSVHWKLSSKSEGLIVKDFSQDLGDSVYILCDLETKFSNGNYIFEPLDEYKEVYDNICSDLTVENALAAALREVRVGNHVKLISLVSRNGKTVPCVFEINNLNDFESAFTAFAKIPMTNEPKQISRLVSSLTDINDSSLIIVTSCITPSSVEEYVNISLLYQNTGVGEPELVYSSPKKFQKENAQAKIKESKLLLALLGHMTVTRRNSEK